MSESKTRVIVSTNTNIRFLTALPNDLSIEGALPFLLNRYKSVIF